MTKAFDQSVGTKWLAKGTKTPWIKYDFAETTAKKVTSYNIGSANDLASRNPKSWVLEGSNDGNVWTAAWTRR
jgi:hypothetical protein